VVLESGRRYLVYLDVWERHLTHIEAPSIREVALGGPDTTTRAQIVWQVRPLLLEDERGDGHTETRLREQIERLYQQLERAQANRRRSGSKRAFSTVLPKSRPYCSGRP
jgi:2-polyprenyl-6-methoxyphenol hydroxylase-like FAD-dependent oxidoreductase